MSNLWVAKHELRNDVDRNDVNVSRLVIMTPYFVRFQRNGFSIEKNDVKDLKHSQPEC